MFGTLLMLLELEKLGTIERLVQNIQPQVSTGNPELLLSLAHAHHAAGYIVSEGTRANESYLSIRHYEQMESIARTLNDHTLLNIALTYIGDMYRRLGKIEKAISYLEAARDTTPLADDAARGNGIQLLGHAYLQQNDINKFERAMAEAEELAFTFDPATSSTRGHYSVGTVYEEYGRAYTKLGQINKAMEYLDKADATLPKTKFWELLVKTARTLTIIQAGDIRSGVQLAIEAAGECRATGNLRYLERIYCVQQYLEDMMRDLDKISRPLRETLDEGRTTELEWRRM
jgi:tetratricopeptide (TPR) repeat protein